MSRDSPSQRWHIFVKTMEIKGFRSIWNHHKCLSQLFPLNLNNYVMGHYKYLNSYSAWIDFSRQILTSVYVKFWRLESNPALNVEQNKMCLSGKLVSWSLTRSLCDRKVECSNANHQGLDFESCVWSAVSCNSSRHPRLFKLSHSHQKSYDPIKLSNGNERKTRIIFSKIILILRLTLQHRHILI